MGTIYCIEVEVTFLPKSEGGRSNPPYVDRWCEYRPHIVIGDPDQRRPIMSPGNFSDETYLAVCFLSGPENVKFGMSFIAELGLIHWPHPVYDAAIPGATFTVREGGTIVGFGTILRHGGERPLDRN